MGQKSRAELFAELEQQVLDSIRNTQQIIRELDEEAQRSNRRKREIASYYRQRRLERLLRSEAT